MKINKRCITVTIFAVLVVFFLGTAHGTNLELTQFPVADTHLSSSAITWQPKVIYEGLALRVAYPDGTLYSTTFRGSSAPFFQPGNLMDGSYSYELKVIPKLKKKDRLTPEGYDRMITRGVKHEKYLHPVTQTGYFTVKGGMIVTNSGSEEVSRTKDISHQDDVIIDGNLCVGTDCSTGHEFGFDIIVLKAPKLRIYFDDTTASPGYPNNDWRIIVNEETGSGNLFAIEDSTNAKRLFVLEAGAPANSIYVDDDGDVGIKTSTPSYDLHIVKGDSPTIRLEQDTSASEIAQTWDLGGNESNFFIRDATHSSKIPFSIEPDAPTNSLFVDSNGAIGQGTQSPSYRFHQVTDSSTNAQVVLARTSGAETILAATSIFGFVGTKNNYALRFLANDSRVMDLNPDGATNDLEMANGAVCTSAGVWTNASSRELKENIINLGTDEAVKTLKKLEPVKFNYKRLKEEQYVGFIADDVPDLVAVNGRKGLAPMDIVAVLTKVMQQQQTTINQLKEKVSKLEQMIKN
jgi:Chaperone of endosialidase